MIFIWLPTTFTPNGCGFFGGVFVATAGPWRPGLMSSPAWASFLSLLYLFTTICLLAAFGISRILFFLTGSLFVCVGQSMCLQFGFQILWASHRVGHNFDACALHDERCHPRIQNNSICRSLILSVAYRCQTWNYKFRQRTTLPLIMLPLLWVSSLEFARLAFNGFVILRFLTSTN